MSAKKDMIKRILYKSVDMLMNNEEFINFFNGEVASCIYYWESADDKLIYEKNRMDLYDLEVDARTYNALKCIGIKYVDQIIKHDYIFFLKLPNFGKGSLRKLKELLSKKNIRWNQAKIGDIK